MRFLLNLPWTLAGVLAGVISIPRSIRVHHKPFALVIEVTTLWWAPKGARATTTGCTVLLSRKLKPHDLEHELVHVEQCNRRPFIHPILYFIESRRRGYLHNKYEIEAYTRAGYEYVED